MPNANPLDQLRDIHLPNAIDWWPLAYGWWLLIALACLSLCAAVVFYLRYRRANRYRQAAITEINTLFQQETDPATLLAQTSALLKRAAMQKFGRQCNQLHGQQWLDFLLQHSRCSDTEQLSAMCLAQYQATPTIDAAALKTQAQLWLKGHK